MTISGRRTLRAQNLGFGYGARTEDPAEDNNRLYSKEHGIGAHELHRTEDALLLASRDEEGPKPRGLMQVKERAPPTPTQPNGSRKESSPDSALFSPEPPLLPGLRWAASKTIKTRRPSFGHRKTRDHSLYTAGVSLPLAESPSLPNGSPVLTPPPLGGIARSHLVVFRNFFLLFRTIL